MIDFKILKTKQLQIQLNVPPFIFKRFLNKNRQLTFNQIWQKLLENTELIFIEPSEIGALTDAPIIRHNNKYYWFSDYMVRDELKELEKNNKVIFELANDENCRIKEFSTID